MEQLQGGVLSNKAEERHRESVYLDLKLFSDRAKPADPELYLSQHEHELVIIDEIHQVPGIFEVLRGVHSRRDTAAVLAGNLGGGGQTVARYLDIMVDLLLVRRLQPWAAYE